jgi:DNA-binding transcriptional MerR regulator
LRRIAAKLYRVREFAELTGVTVRALHHYDRLGLLRPCLRSSRGYRLYGEQDLVRLEQIVVLKFLGLPLKEIQKLLKGDSVMVDILQRQQAVLTEKRKQLDTAICAIERAKRSLESTGRPDYTLFNQIIQEIEMQNDTEWSEKYYSPEAKAKVESRKALWSPELQEKASRQWSELFADIEAALAAGENPSGPKAQVLAARWKELVAGFTGSDPEIQKGLNKMWADQENWPEPQRSAYGVKPEIQEFIMKAMRAK